MKRIKKRLCLGGILACLFLMSGTALAAQQTERAQSEEKQNPQNVTSEKRQEALSRLLSQNPEDAGAPVTERPAVADTSFNRQFSYSEDVLLSGIFETKSLFFEVPKYWECSYVYAQIEFTLSQMIQDDVPATLTFMVNDTPVHTCRMDYGNGRSQIIYVEIPVNLLKKGYNTFDITGYVRLYDEEGCIDDFSGANWVNISRNSFVEVGYEMLPHGNKISFYPYPFISSADPEGMHTQVVVSDEVENSELAAALLLRADIAAETEDEDAITLCKASDMSADSAGTVMVSLADNLPEKIKGQLTDEELTNPHLNSASLIRFIEDGHGNPLLLVTSKSPECLMEGAMMLVDETRVTQEDSSTAWVLENASQKVMEAKDANRLTAERYTIEGIVGSGINYTGPFHQEYTVYLPFSGGYVLANSSKISLQFRYSDNLDFDRSLITVYWGDVPVASKRLSRDYADGDELSFTMPADVIGTSASSLKIAFDLEIPELFCTPRMEDMPWAYVSGDSSLYLPLGVSGLLSFDLRPFPFEESSMFNDVMAVIPDMPTKVEMDTLGRVIAMYGENVTSYGSIQVKRASEMKQNDANYNIIALGTYQNNALIKELNSRLAFPYSEDGESFTGNSQQVLSENYARRIALMELLPWDEGENRSVLVVGGVNDSTINLVNEFLKKDSNLWTLSHDTVLLDGSDEARSYSMLEQKKNLSEPDLKTFLKQNKDSVVFTVTATAAMVLLFFGCLLILLRIYGRSKEKL